MAGENGTPYPLAMTLPDGFHWNPHFAGHALLVDGHVAAKFSVTPGAPYVLAYLHCDKLRMTARTFAGEANARAYIEGWARRWHLELMQEYGVSCDGAQEGAGDWA